MNCLAVEQSDGIVIVDCGTGFPHDDVGVDVIHPDFSWLFERAERVKGLFLTHGHEDHIGAVPYLVPRLRCPVWGPPHALGLVRHRLQEHHEDVRDFELLEATPGQRYDVGPFEIEPIRVSHSIVEASALAIRTAAGMVVHTGDFTLDPDPPDGEPTDERRLREIGDRGVALLLSDSTNIDVTERSGSERSVGDALERIIGAAEGRVFVVMFASNIQRLMLLGKIAERSGRKLCLLGRSLQTHVEVCHRIGRLNWPSDLLIAPEHVRDYPRDRVILLSGGSQAERNSAMRRVASGVHPTVEVEAGDTVVFSSRIIPGNDRPVLEMIGDLLRRGAKLHWRASDPDVHTSGHAARSEQLRMIELVRPRSFVPVHGTLHHMTRHAQLARDAGVGDVLVLENGSAARFDRQGLALEGNVPSGKIAIALGGATLRPETRGRRAELGRSGVVHVALALDARGAVIAGPDVVARGVPEVDDDDVVLRSIAREVVAQLERVRHYKHIDLTEELRRAVRRRVLDVSGTRPVVEVQLLEFRGR